MLAGAILLASLYVLPIWNITLDAPQYPTSLGMDIHITKLADTNPNDIQNINLMNHYIGMKSIPDELEEFKIFPWVVGFMIIFGLFIGYMGWHKMYLVWFIIMVVLGIAGMYDFYLWEYDYGHSLSPNAAIKFMAPDGSPMAYQPPLIGSELILNFKAHSYPRSGTFFLILGMGLSFLAFLVGKAESRQKN